MGLFGNKETRIVNVVELSDETRQALTKLENDLQVVTELLNDVMQTGKSVLGMLYGEAHTDGVQVVAGDPNLTQAGTPRQRAMPFKRRPRHEQVEWLMEVLSDRQWHNAADIAKENASDSREARYLRSSVGGRFREMEEDGICERRASGVPGVMFEYRLKQG